MVERPSSPSPRHPDIAEDEESGVAFGTSIQYDDAYAPDSKDNFAGEVVDVDSDDDAARGIVEEDEDAGMVPVNRRGAPSDSVPEITDAELLEGRGGEKVDTKISNREKGTYNEKRAAAAAGRFADGDDYKHTMRRRAEQEDIEKEKEDGATSEVMAPPPGPEQSKRRKRRWDDGGDTPAVAPTDAPAPPPAVSVSSRSRWDGDDEASDASSLSSVAPAGRRRRRWDETPLAAADAGVPASVAAPANRWDDTPLVAPGAAAVTAPAGKRNRWDATPLAPTLGPEATPLLPVAGPRAPLATPLGVPGGPGATPLSSAPLARLRRAREEMSVRNRPWNLEALEAILPTRGYRMLDAPADYRPVARAGRDLLGTPAPSGPDGFSMVDSESVRAEDYGIPLQALGAEAAAGSGGKEGMAGLPFVKSEDMQYFGRLMEEVDEEFATVANSLSALPLLPFLFLTPTCRVTVN